MDFNKFKKDIKTLKTIEKKLRLNHHIENISLFESDVNSLVSNRLEGNVKEIKGIISQIKYDIKNSSFNRENQFRYTQNLKDITRRCISKIQ